MQFTIEEYVGNPTKKVIFDNSWEKIEYNSRLRIKEIFSYLGGIHHSNGHWEFPVNINNDTIIAVIKNTCFICGGLMKNSTALHNGDLYGLPDVVGKQTIYSQADEAKLRKVRKCSHCGHSHT